MTDGCPACRMNANAASDRNLVWANEDWLLYHWAAPAPGLGWMLMYSRRHIPGAVAFTRQEAGAFGRVVQAISQAQLEATGALRVYLASLSESTPHFHIHFAPRYADGASSWDKFADIARAQQGLIEVDPVRVEQVIDEVGAKLVAALGGSTRRRS